MSLTAPLSNPLLSLSLSPTLSNPNFVKEEMDSKPPSSATGLIVSWSLWALVQYWLMSALHGTWRRLHEVEAPINYCYSFAVAVFMGFQLITILIGLLDLKWLARKLSPIDKVAMDRVEYFLLINRRKMLIHKISICYESPSFGVFVWCCFDWAEVELSSFSVTCSLVWDHLISYCSSTRSTADKGSSSSRRGGDRARATPAATGDRDLEFGGTGNGGLVAVGGRDPGGGGGGGRAEGRRDPAMLAYWIALISLIITTVIGMLGLLAALRALGPNNFRDILNADSAIVVFGVLYVSGIITWIIWLLGAFQ